MLIGKRLNGRYKILEMIGGGGMANVYLARDIILERDVAIKVLRLDFANEEEFIRRFQREAHSGTSLVHSNIVNIYDVGEEENINYIVMEYVDGLTLKQYIQQYSPIEVEKALDIMKQLVSAIAFAHHHSIIHRDIKPQNILIDRNGTVKITDFGIAMALSATSITQTNAVLGSVHYISPEQARGGIATRKSDIYSLGIVMFELLTGRLPFSGESAVSIALKHLQSETPSLRRWQPDIPQSVENIVLKATAKDPRIRYNHAEEMLEDLETALDPERVNEPKFIIPIDDEATKAIPVITNEHQPKELDHTIVAQKSGLSDEQTKEISVPKKKKKWPLFMGIFLFLILAGLAAVFVPSMLGPKELEIPDVSGKTLDEAISSIMTKGFIVGDTISRFSDEVPEGRVIETKPPAGDIAEEGSNINIYVSAGKETIEVDDYTGRDYEEIYSLLEKKGFKSIRKETTHDDSVEGTVLEQDPKPDEKVVPSETEITLTVSAGPEKIELIDLSGYNEKSLQDYAESTGLTITVIRTEFSDTVDKGLVLSQKPSPGTKLSPGDKVEVAVSDGPKEIPPKTVHKEITIPYEPEEEGQPQEIHIYIEDMEHSMTEPYDTFYITEETKRDLEFLIEAGKKAGYKVMRDQKVIIDETIPYPETDENTEGGM